MANLEQTYNILLKCFDHDLRIIICLRQYLHEEREDDHGAQYEDRWRCGERDHHQYVHHPAGKTARGTHRNAAELSARRDAAPEGVSFVETPRLLRQGARCCVL